MIIFRIRGVVREDSGVGIAGLFVKACDKDLRFDDLLGGALTNEEGRFEILVEPDDFRDFFERRPDLYFKVFRAGHTELIHATEEGVSWDIRRCTEAEIRIPHGKLFPPEARRVGLAGEDGTAQEVFEAGESLSVTAAGLRPAATYEVAVAADGEELFSTRLITNLRGELEPTILWPQMGLDDPRGGEPWTYEQARERWQGRTIEVLLRDGREVLVRSSARLAAGFSRPLVMSTDAGGRVLNGFEQGRHGLTLSLYNLPFHGEARVYMVARQRNWQTGDPFTVATLTDGSPAAREITIPEGRRDLRLEFAAADRLPTGAFDFIVRPLRYGYEEDDHLRLLPADVSSGRRTTGLVVREAFWTAKPVLGGCVNKLPVSGRILSSAPYFQYSDTFAIGENVWGALDPGIIDPGNVSKMCALYVIKNKTSAQWNVDNSLQHLPALGGNGAVIKIKVQTGCINANEVLLWPGASTPGTYDIVADFGNNTPDAMAFVPDDAYNTPLDVIDGYFVAGFRVVQDPGTSTDPGLFAGSWSYDENVVTALGLQGTVMVEDENTFYAAPGNFNVLNRQVRLKANVFFPADMAGVTDPAQISASQPDYPLIVVVHGNGQNYTAYDFLLQHWARNGFIAASIDNRFLQGQNPVHGMHGLGRANNFFKHLAVLQAKFGGKLQNNIGIMGHSRGGEAAVKIARLNQQLGLGHGIKALLSLAPTDQYGKEVLVGASATPFFVLYGSRDGDVSGMNPAAFPQFNFDWRMTGFSLYDRAAGAPKSMAFVYKATHNGFITTNSDNPGDGTISETKQKPITQAYATAFFRQHLRNEPQWKGMFSGEWKAPSVVATGAEVYSQYREPGGKTIDDFEGAIANWQSSTIAGTASHGATLPADPAEGRLFDYVANPGLDLKSPHDSKGLKLQWNNLGDRLTWTIPPAHKDVSGFDVLSLRVTQKEGSASNVPSQAQDFRLTLKDAASNQRPIRVASFGAVPFPDQRADADLRKSAMTTLRIPLTAYTVVCAGQPKVDLTNVVELSLDFSMKATGEIEVDEIEFSH